MATFKNHIQPDIVYGGYDGFPSFEVTLDKSTGVVHLLAFAGDLNPQDGPIIADDDRLLIAESLGRSRYAVVLDADDVQALTDQISPLVADLGSVGPWSDERIYEIRDQVEDALIITTANQQPYDDWLRKNDHENWLDQHRDDDPEQLECLDLTDEEAAALGVNAPAPGA